MQTVNDIIDALGGTSQTARSLGLNFPARVSDWRRRRSIPVEHWPGLLAAAASRGVSLSYETLVHVHARPKRAA